MAVDRELQLLARRGRNPRALTQRVLDLIARRSTLRAYARVFLDDDGELSRDGARVIADMANAAGLGKVRPDADAATLQFREGKRAVLLHVLAKLEPQAIEHLARQIREANNDRSTDDTA